MKVCLSKFHWYSNDTIWVTGFIREKDKYLTNNELISFFKGIDSIQKFEQLLKNANGQFSVIIRNSDEIWAATDKLRNYPLFYMGLNHDFIIGDDCYKLTEELSEKWFNSESVDSFLSAGYVLNNFTLVKDIFQVEAGEYIVAGTKLFRKFYFDNSYNELIEKDFKASAVELQNILSEVFKSHFKALRDKFIVIPLSGGYDSRLVALMCAKYHPENVLCYTYGTENNIEVAPAKEVAKRLGFKWINVIYNSGLIEGYLNDDLFKDYYPYISNLSSMFFMQEYFAIKYLKDNNLVPDNSVFMPGFSGDALAGSHILSGLRNNFSRDYIANQIFNEFFGLIKLTDNKKLNIIRLIIDKIQEEKYQSWKVFENWDQKERQAKFVVNSAKVYLFFGYDYVLPFWDDLLINFFSNLPFHFKLNKKLYDYVMTEYLFKDFNLNLSREINALPARKAYQKIKEKIKKIVPDKIKDLFITHKSPIFYDEITKSMIKELGPETIHPRQSNYYNSYITQWYLLKANEHFDKKKF